MTTPTAPREPLPAAAFVRTDAHRFRATALTRGPWHPDHQHAGPPIALVCGEIERVAAQHGLNHLARLTANLLRPVPIAELTVEVATDYAGRNAGHFSARLQAGDKEIARFTALAQRESDAPVPDPRPAGLLAPAAPRAPADCPVAQFPFAGRHVGYSDLVETRLAAGRMFDGPSTVWFRLRHPLVEGETPSACQRLAVAADSGNGISAALDFRQHTFVNSDLTIHLLRPAQGEWICLEARTLLGPNGTGLAETMLYDEGGAVGRGAQSLIVRKRE